jgi:transaldolase
MARIPTPPPMTTPQMIQQLQSIWNPPTSNPSIYQQAILDAAEVKRIALEQAQKAIEEYMKVEQEKRKRTFLTIENIDKIRGSKYSESLYVGGVKEWDNHYEFTLLGYSSNQIETILLHRRQTDDKRYVMEYKGHTIWLNKDELSSIDRIIECMTKV